MFNEWWLTVSKTYSCCNLIPYILHWPLKITRGTAMMLLSHRPANINDKDCSFFFRHVWCWIPKNLSRLLTRKTICSWKLWEIVSTFLRLIFNISQIIGRQGRVQSVRAAKAATAFRPIAISREIFIRPWLWWEAALALQSHQITSTSLFSCLHF